MSAVYLYGMTRDPVALPPIEGVDGCASVESLSCGPVICWISRLDADAFGARVADAAADLEWLSATGVRHQRVVDALAAHATILPAKFGTIFSMPDALIADVARRKRPLAAAFRRVEGAEEWGVKVFQIPQTAPRVTARTGREYLQRKSTLAGAASRRGADPAIRSLADALSRASAEACPGGPIASGQPGLLWHASFLVRRTTRSRFDGVITTFERAWAKTRRIECTGPWPPYSFVGE